MPSPLLQIRNATKIYSSGGFMGRGGNSVVALDDFNLTIDHSPATITTIAGESGSGKTTLANLVLGFIRLTEGQIIYDGEDVTEMTDAQLKMYRRNVQAVFQDPFGVYNPFYRIEHVFQLVNRHFNLSDNKSEFRDMVEAGLNVVGLQGEDVLPKYPHQLSGGQRQRIMMARAYMIKPRLIVADEPVSMVDASLRASILDAMLRLRDDHNISFLYITHDLSTAYQIGDRIYMLYQGTTAERGRALDVIDNPQHPYVQLLIDSVPVPDPTEKWDVNISLPSEEEMRTASAKGCRYYPRCPHRMDHCLTARPPLYQMNEQGHEAACYLYDDREVTPDLPPVELKDPSVDSGRSRIPAAAAVVVAIVAIGLLLAALSGGQAPAEEDTPDDTTSQVADADTTPDEDTTTAEVEDETETTDTDETEESAVPEVLISADGAIEKTELTLNESVIDEITSEEEKHSYTFEGTAGQTVELRVNAEGSAFTSPYAYMYDADGEFVAVAGDTTVRAKRSWRQEVTLPADGTYTIVVAPYDGSGIEEYAVLVESVEAEEPATDEEATDADTEEPAEEVVVPDVLITADGATEKTELTLNESVIDEITSEDEKHSYTYEGTAGQTVELRVNAEGSAFTSPYAYMYDADGEFVAVAGDTTVRAKRSWRKEVTLPADGTYTIVVGPYDGNGVEEYAVLVEGVAEEADADTGADDTDAEVDAGSEETVEEVTVPEVLITADGATEKSALTLGESTLDEITSEDEKHSYTFDASDGQTVILRVNAEGSAFTSPYAYMYDADGEFVAVAGDTTVRAKRSWRSVPTTLSEGTYTIVVGPYDGNGVEEYAVLIETAEE